MKGRLIFGFVLGLMLLLCAPVFAADLPSVALFIDGKQVTSGVISDDRTMVPLRIIGESLGAEVDWEADTQSVSVKKAGKDIQMVIGRNMALVDQNPVYLDKAPMLVNDRTMVPLRFISERFGAKVYWDQYTRTVYISTKGEIILPKPVLPPMPQKPGPEQIKWFADVIGPNALYVSNERTIQYTYYPKGYNASDYFGYPAWYALAAHKTSYQLNIRKYDQDGCLETVKAQVLDYILPGHSQEAYDLIKDIIPRTETTENHMLGNRIFNLENFGAYILVKIGY